MPGLYKIVGGSHYDSDAKRHCPGDTYSPTDQELAAFPDRFEFVAEEIIKIAETSEPIEEYFEHLKKVAGFTENTNPGVVLKAIADGHFTAQDALACEWAGLARLELIASLEAVIEGRIEPHPDNVISLDDLANLPAIEDEPEPEDDQGAIATFRVADATIDQVLERVEAGEISADVALALERGREKPRKGLLSKLEAMVE